MRARTFALAAATRLAAGAAHAVADVVCTSIIVTITSVQGQLVGTAQQLCEAGLGTTVPIVCSGDAYGRHDLKHWTASSAAADYGHGSGSRSGTGSTLRAMVYSWGRDENIAVRCWVLRDVLG